MKKLMTYQHFLALFLFSLLILFCSQPSNFFYTNVKLDNIVQNDIIAPKSTTYIDKTATQELKNETLKNIKNIYDSDPSISESQLSELDTFFSSLINGQNELKTSNLSSVASSLNNPYNFSQYQLELLLNIPQDEAIRIEDYLKDKIKKIYDSGVTKDNLKSVQDEFKNDSNLYVFNSSIRIFVVPKLSNGIEINEIFNKVETDKQKQETLSKITPVYKKISKGEVIARKGDKITEDHIVKLEALDLINHNFNWTDFLRQYPAILLFTVLFHFYCGRFLSEQLSSMRKYIFTFLLISLVVFLSPLMHGALWFLIPYLTALIVFAVFWGRNFVIAASIFVGFLINGDDFIYMFLSLIIGVSLSFLYNNFRKFTDAIKTGFLLGLIVAVSYLILSYTFEQQIVLTDSISFIFSGFLSGIIANGIIPLIEDALGMTTIYKLTELNKYDHPILEELYRKAKGTYDHSRNVSHLCASASNRIGANTLLLKVAALYHDLGKIEHPEYFIENSNPKNNIHDSLDPIESAKIILQHPERGLQLCKKYNIPKEVIDVIYCHHGDSALFHFYQKALEQGLDVSLENFKYKTPTPKTKEQGILMLADSCEAFSRSLSFESIEELETQLREFVYKKIKQGALRDCELGTKDIEICLEEFTPAIFATHHQRVKYTTDKVEK